MPSRNAMAGLHAADGWAAGAAPELKDVDLGDLIENLIGDDHDVDGMDLDQATVDAVSSDARNFHGVDHG